MLTTVSPPRSGGKHHAARAKRRAKLVVLPLLAFVALYYALHARWKAQELALAAESLQLADLDLKDDEPPEQRTSAAAAYRSQPPLVSSWALEAERATWHRAPKYSTHTCIGQKFYDNWHLATCKFDNMCINASTTEFEYYIDPQFTGGGQGPFVDFDANGNALIDFPKNLLNPGHSRIDTNVSWRPVVKRGRFPKLGPRVKWAPSSQALVHAMPPPLLWNFGHVMFDVLVPIFNMQHQFGLYDPTAQVLIPFAINGSDDDLRQWLPKLINTKQKEKSVLHLTYHSPATWVREYAAGVLGSGGDGLVCFRTVLAGTGALNRQQADVDSLPYRQAVVWHLGLAEPPHAKPVISILNKKGRRTMENSREVAKIVRERYPRAQVDVYDFGQHPDMTMREQVQLMSDTSILITPCGGLATVLTFLRPQSTAIVLNYWNTHLNRSLQMEDNYYQHMEYLDFQYMPVTPADYEGTNDRPWCEIVDNGTRLEDAHYSMLGSLVHCNVHFQGEGLDRLLNYVDAAMLRWAAHSGHYNVLKGGKRLSYSPLTAPVAVPATTGGPVVR